MLFHIEMASLISCQAAQALASWNLKKVKEIKLL
jgi:hypothetical protein